MSAYAKGPWEAATFAGWPSVLTVGRVRINIGGYSIAEMKAEPEKPAEIVATARLISAAPELLEALKGFVEEWDELCMNQLSPAYIAAIAAIAKAEGK